MSSLKAKLVAATAAAVTAVAFGPAASDARKVNTGNATELNGVVATITDGHIRVKSQTFSLSDMNPKPTLTGTVTESGTWTVPKNNVVFPNMSLDGGITARFVATHDWTGSINPITGAAQIRGRLKITISGSILPGGCSIGTDGSPIDVNTATTGTSGAVTGTPYNETAGSAAIVNNTVAVPSSSGCGIGAGTVNDTLDLPSPAGQNEARFVLQFNPVLKRGIQAKMTPSATSGFAPLTVNFDGSTSTAKNGSTFTWTFGNGTSSGTARTASRTYEEPGTYNVKMHINDGADTDEVTVPITVTGRPDLKITKTKSGNFRAGSNVSYQLDVENNGKGPAGTVTVTDTVPAGLELQSASGTGWSCGAAGQTITCTRPSLAHGTSAPPITINSKVALTAPSQVTNTASVSTANETATGDNTSAPVVSDITRVDLAITKTQLGNLRPNRNAKYLIAVENLGDHETVGPTTVTDILPTGIGWVSDDAPDGWDCTTLGQMVTCTTTDAIAPGEVDEIELTVQPDNRAWVGTVTNTASVATVDDVNLSNNSSSVESPVIVQPDLIVSKSHTGNFRVGTNGTYSIAVTNDGAQDSSGTITVTDTLPAGLSFVSAAGTGWTCGAVDQTVTCTRDDALAPDATTPAIDLEVDVLPSAAASVDNTATVSNASDVIPSNNSHTDTATVNRVDLSIDKRAPGGFRVGDTATYVLDVHNDGTANTFAPTTVTDTLPAGLTYDSATGSGWNCSATGQDVTCTRTGAILAGADAGDITLDVTVDENAVPEVVNTAAVATEDDVDASNDSDSITVPVTTVDLGIDKSHNGAFRVGTNRSYKLAIENFGSFASTGATTVTDVLPAGLTFVSASGSGWSCSATGQTVTCERGALIGANATAPSIVIQVAVGSAAAPSVTNTATVSTNGDRNALNDSDSDQADVVFNDVDVEVAHSPATFRAGGEGTYRLTVDNDGGAATGAPTTLTSTLPAGVSFRAARDGEPDAAGTPWDCSASAGQSVSCEHSGSIAAGGRAQYLDVDVNVAPTAPASIATSWNVATANDPVAANDQASDEADVESLDLSITNTHQGDLRAGENGTYKIEVENEGDFATDSTTFVRSTLPAGLGYVGANGDDWDCSRVGQNVTCRHDGPIDDGATTSFDLEVAIAGDAGPAVTTTATVDNASDVNATNDSDSDTAPIGAQPDASVRIVPALRDGDSLRSGSTGTWDVAVRNAGRAPTSGPTVVTTTLPAGLTFKAARGTGWACAVSGQDITCTHAGVLGAGARSNLALETDVVKTDAPTTVVEATVATPGDVVADNNKDRATVVVSAVDLKVDIRHLGDFVTSIGNDFTIAVSNEGTANTVGASTVTGRLPDGVRVEELSGEGWACSFQVPDFRCTRMSPIDAANGAPNIKLRVIPSRTNVPTVTAGVAVATEGDAVAANNTDSDSANTILFDPSAPGGEPEGPTGLTVTAGSLKVTRSGTVSLKVACAGSGTCKGTLALKGKKKVKRKVPSLGSARFSVDGGKSKTIKVRLSRAGLKLVKASKKYAATATATLSPAVDGIKPATRSISILPYKAPKKK